MAEFLDRRTLLRAGATAGLVAAGAMALGTRSSVEVRPRALKTQMPWRHCKYCQGLVWGDGLYLSKCPAGGAHVQTGSLPYFLHYKEYSDDPPPQPAAFHQPGWQHCKTCQGLAYTVGVTGWCPAGKPHDHTGSYAYLLPFNSDDIPVYRQNGWRFCDKCMGIYYGPGQVLSRCPKGGQHHAPATSHDYRLRYDAFGPVG
jgi:hypothetical protein